MVEVTPSSSFDEMDEVISNADFGSVQDSSYTQIKPTKRENDHFQVGLQTPLEPPWDPPQSPLGPTPSPRAPPGSPWRPQGPQNDDRLHVDVTGHQCPRITQPSLRLEVTPA